MSMYDCDLVVCSTVTVHHDCLFSSRSTYLSSLFSSSTLCFRWETNSSFLSTNTRKCKTWSLVLISISLCTLCYCWKKNWTEAGFLNSNLFWTHLSTGSVTPPFFPHPFIAPIKHELSCKGNCFLNTCLRWCKGCNSCYIHVLLDELGEYFYTMGLNLERYSCICSYACLTGTTSTQSM